jgi:hypothetical protein
MSADLARVFSSLKPLLASQSRRLQVKKSAAVEYTLVTQSPSPFPQHKGQPMWFGSVRMSKASVSYHLMPLYMNAALCATISPALRKHMHGKSCFNFKARPDAPTRAELKRLTRAAADHWATQKWL